ncbi:MAG TPA: NAD(P)/FAD-dependent oxidoreductase [Longimicrobiaceae bacterium]|jgi:thioredoxin reductase|nr:NAD(P)/FAD-dependent oxidoreductase [Longimicrobiaceae bacterium]
MSDAAEQHDSHPAGGTACDYDAIVIGGGPAGLAAALWLARYKLRVKVFDAENPRNEPTWAVHGYLGLPDVPPLELRRIGREQATEAGAEYEEATVQTVAGECDDFHVTLVDGRACTARRVLFATGLRDIIPEIPGLEDFYGTSIWHCPDCDGPGVEGLRVGVIGWGRQIAAFCMEMLTWTEKLTILTHGKQPDLPRASWEALERFSIPVRTDTIVRIEGREGLVQRAVFADGSVQEFDAMFFHIAYGPGCSLPAELGCGASEGGILLVDEDFETTLPGIYAAGDITPGSKLAIHAAADGTRAAIGIYRSLLPPERRV